MASTTSYLLRDNRHQLSALEIRIYLDLQPTTLNTDNHRCAGLAFSVTPSQQQEV